MDEDEREKERWHLVDYVKTRDEVFRVSTIFLGPDYDMPYETMVFAEDGITLSEEPMWRYKTKEEAEDNHQKIVRALKNGNYMLIPSEFTLHILKEAEGE